MSTIKVGETHERLEQSTRYEIETIMGATPTWTPLLTYQVKHEGKFIAYHPDFLLLTSHETRVLGDEAIFSFTDEVIAKEMARSLAHVWDRPLRVVKVQRIRIQNQIGKVYLPVGGI